MRYKLTVQYDGTDFCGWQKQFPHEDAITNAPRMEVTTHGPHGAAAVTPGVAATEPTEASADNRSSDLPDSFVDGRGSVDAVFPDRPRIELRTVQSVLERAVRYVVHQPIIIHGASRTDSGVHARGQVAAFSTIACDDPSGHGKVGGWPIERGTNSLARAINSRLPRDVLVTSAEVVDESFNPINGAVSKGYSYTIWNAQERTLWDRRTSLHIYHALDVAKMQAAAEVLVGEHDFAAFAAAGHGRATTVRTIHGCTVQVARENLIRIDVSGSGFLWNMVRIIAGTLVEAGKGRLTPDNIREALATGDRRKAGPTLPPHGLCLEWIRYA